MVSFDLEADVEGRPEFPGELLDIHKLFLQSYARVTGGAVTFEPLERGGKEGVEGATAYAFFDSDTFQGLVGFFAPAGPVRDQVRMVIHTASVQAVVLYDIVGGAAGPIRDVKPDFKSNTTRVPVAVLSRPLVLQYARVLIKGFEAEKEQLQIRETGLITEIYVPRASLPSFMADHFKRHTGTLFVSS